MLPGQYDYSLQEGKLILRNLLHHSPQWTVAVSGEAAGSHLAVFAS